jgi:hypothetical protein
MLIYVMSCHGLGGKRFEGRIGMQNFEIFLYWLKYKAKGVKALNSCWGLLDFVNNH